MRIREKKLAIITGISFISKPYKNHNAIPKARNTNIIRDMSFADLVLYILRACGIRAEVVMMPAISPITSEKFLNKSIAMFISNILLLNKFFIK